MNFPWYKYIELPTNRRKTLQVFITNVCTLSCRGCFARNVMKGRDEFITIEEYTESIESFIKKGGEKINLMGGEPTLHPFLERLVKINKTNNLRTTIYTNGARLAHWNEDYFYKYFGDITIRLSLYSRLGAVKSLDSIRLLGRTGFPIEVCFMVSSTTTKEELLLTAIEVERDFNCKVFFISSLRELDNLEKDFFTDTNLTMPVIKYKKLVHKFLDEYEGRMQIHISKRGVFESTTTMAENKCIFANYFIGGKIIQCPYDIVNLKYQDDYELGIRYCRHNNTCLMSKIIVKRKVT